MKKYRNILFTSGRGPVECELAVHGIQNKFKQLLQAQKLNFEIISQRLGQAPKSMMTIIFQIKSIESPVYGS